MILKMQLIVPNDNPLEARLIYQMFNSRDKCWYDIDMALEAQAQIIRNLEKHNKLGYFNFN